ncbi:hypothetical protein SNE25_27145 [Mucilaginibacter sabulilitoris]|uniref:SRPBCC family protein n=1 Tax=Mucilaginibacter sabulilitoris TaxID=1173583 RepID=A0ABZ0TLF8_9SPHI|nr:hypothetical protein [Mucilaginibacter sabulilitoris]WPU93003.1 hypothetical protein SNE25_27145 [Mucilaginibacter sabulilitoris]
MKLQLRVTLAIFAAVAFAFIVRYLFAIDSLSALYSVMTVTFLLCLPFGVGYLTVYICKDETVEYSAAAFFVPFIPIFIFFFATLLIKVEGMACWIMIMPIFLILAGLGGITARYIKFKKRDKNKTFVYIVLLLPFFLSPIEKMIGAIPGTYKAYTEIDIRASKEQIWKNVTRVRAIDKQQDSAAFTRFFGFPRPIKAELDKEAVGGRRKAIFDKGLVFDEEVTAYQPLKSMTFTIHANPYDIPSTTMDKHIVVGGEFFDVLNGTYQLERLDAINCRLHLFSTFKLNTTFNFYAGIWASWIMKDIQQNILKVIKERSESEARIVVHT